MLQSHLMISTQKSQQPCRNTMVLISPTTGVTTLHSSSSMSAQLTVYRSCSSQGTSSRNTSRKRFLSSSRRVRFSCSHKCSSFFPVPLVVMGRLFTSQLIMLHRAWQSGREVQHSHFRMCFSSGMTTPGGMSLHWVSFPFHLSCTYLLYVISLHCLIR